MFSKIYIEITNVCNKKCSFCPGHTRAPRFMSGNEFSTALKKTAPYTKSILFHLMGEPMLHPLLPEFITAVGKSGCRPILTTNGSLTGTKGSALLGKGLYRINISLHSFEANTGGTLDDYLSDCFSFARLAAEDGIFTVFRLWNDGGLNELNREIIGKAEKYFGGCGEKTEKGLKVSDRIFIEFGRKFEWQRNDENIAGGEKIRCLGMRDQVGILCDGSVLPCCIDSEGSMTLGNIFNEELPDIISCERGKKIRRGFETGTFSEETCRRCGYRLIFND